jgi:hypothetical protein
MNQTSSVPPIPIPAVTPNHYKDRFLAGYYRLARLERRATAWARGSTVIPTQRLPCHPPRMDLIRPKVGFLVFTACIARSARPMAAMCFPDSDCMRSHSLANHSSRLRYSRRSSIWLKRNLRMEQFQRGENTGRAAPGRTICRIYFFRECVTTQKTWREPHRIPGQARSLFR